MNLEITPEQAQAAQAAGFILPPPDSGVSLGDDAIRKNAVMALEAAQNAWLDTRRFLTAENNLDDLPAGAAAIPNVLTARALSAPDEYPGVVLTYPIGSLSTIQEYLSLRGGRWSRRKLAQKWGTWEKDGETDPKPLSADDNLDTLTGGPYLVSNVLIARALGAPDEYPGILLHYPVGAKGALQSFTSLRGGTWHRPKVNNSWKPWHNAQPEAPAPPPPAPAPAVDTARRELLRQGLSARKGGSIGTGGRGVIALRFDDAPAEFREKILPHLQRLALPFTRVSTSQSIGETPIDPAEFPLMQDYCLASGGEVWNHGKDHLDAAEESLQDNIIGALDSLRESMPRLAIDCFAPPGGAAISYAGHMPSNGPENWATPAGALIMGHHALASGYLKETYYRPLDGLPRDGQIHYSVDKYTLPRVKMLVNRARDWKTGVVLMWHGHNIDQPGCMSLDDLVSSLEYVAAEREAGNILVLTVSGMAYADSGSEVRDDLLPESEFDESLEHRVTYPQYRQNVPGSIRELTASVTGTPGQQVTSEIAGMALTHTVPESGALKLRHVVTLPTDITALDIKISAPAHNAHCYAL